MIEFIKFRKHWGIVFLVLIFLFVFPGQSVASLDTKWESDLHLTPERGDPFKLSSKLSVEYSFGDLTWSSKSILNEEGYQNQIFGLDYSLGVLDFDNQLAFFPQQQRLDYWLSESRSVLGGVEVDYKLLREYVYETEEFGFGSELTLYGSLSREISVQASALFGMRENLVETLGWQRGSGYDVVPPGGTVETQPFRLLAHLTGLQLGECQLDLTTKLSANGGWEYFIIDTEIALDDLPLSSAVSLKFAPQTLSAKLSPKLNLTWKDTRVYLDLVDSISGLQVEGIELKNLDFGPLKFSSMTAMTGNLYKNRRGPGEISLRASDYFIDPEDPAYYDQTIYDEVFSLETQEDSIGDSLYIGMDFYFDMGDSSELFDLRKVTAEAQYEVTESLEFDSGASFNLGNRDQTKFLLGFSLVA